VYENRAARSGRMIKLRVAVLPARAPAPAPDPIFYFTGGPGGSAVSDVPVYANAWRELNEARDIVFVDQRGTGESNKLVCPLPDASLDGANAAQLEAYLDSCFQNIEGDPRWYTTRAFVDDVDEVRAALGYDKINIVGGSYGATAVQVYLLVHPASVRTMTILNGTLLDIPVLERIAASSERALRVVLERCGGNEACQAAFPDVTAEFDTVLRQLDAQAFKTDVLDPTGAPILVTRDVFNDVVHSLLFDSNGATRLPRLIHRAASGDWKIVAEDYRERVLSQSSEGTRLVMSITIRCHESWARFTPQGVERSGAGSYIVENQVSNARVYEMACRSVPKPPPEAMYGATVRSDVAVLVLNSDEDPQNPPENVAGTQDIYPNSRVLFEPYRGHATVNWVCITQVLGEFIASGDPASIRGACLSKVRAFPFDTRP
jgi:pimeloyl-ACP methyl ester carboxylesterase